ncbi:MAG: cobyrinate a,c-diamide synthase, partial [Acidobacteria bacterium]|nr:cobyrinate a,c-diamide synthase [Acidobacteriota bacterium]
PRLVIAGLAGDSGKTLVSLGLAGILRSQGMAVAPYKKGPDYIDAAWLGAAAGRPGRNLDTFMMPPAGIGRSLAAAAAADLVLVEGNRGLHDGMDAAGTHSTAELAKRIGAPVVLVVDVTKATRTVAALVLGCRLLDPEVELAGVILNRVATGRQERLIRRAVEKEAGVSVLGAVPRLGEGGPLPGRHLGLVTVGDHPAAAEALARAAWLVEGSVDVDRMVAMARERSRPVELRVARAPSPVGRARVAVARDEAFCFYYPENLEALEAAGAELSFFSPLEDRSVPSGAGALYLGGGFPELHARALADNRSLRRDLVTLCGDGLPVYAECGGLMALARELVVEGERFPMAGVLDLVVEQGTRPRGHGYVVANVGEENPWYPVGTTLRGHEFHYSRVIDGADAGRTVLELKRGMGVDEGRDGIVAGTVWASYLHLHAWTAPGWAGRMVRMAAGAGRLRLEPAAAEG